MNGTKWERAALSAYIEERMAAENVEQGDWVVEITTGIEAYHDLAAAKEAVDAAIAKLKGGA